VEAFVMSDQGRYEEQLKAVHEVTNRFGRILLVMSGKGGVGKSSVAVNLAVGLAEAGHRVGLLDVDFHGPSIPRLLGFVGKRVVLGSDDKMLPLRYAKRLKVLSMGNCVESRDDAVMWRGPMKGAVIRQFVADTDWGKLDYLVVDSPPGTGDEPMSVCQSMRGAQAVVVTTPQQLSVDDVRRSISFCRSLETPVLGVIENMSGLHCPSCGETIELFGSGGGEALCEEMGETFLGRIPIDPEVVAAGDEGRPLVADAPATPAGRALAEIVDRIRDLAPVERAAGKNGKPKKRKQEVNS
jgi:Mrp family chromosome partitioning ATPase